MPLSSEDLRFAINDARMRHAATVETIAAIDRQALSFLQLYVTLAGAALSGAGVILLSTSSYPRGLAFGLIGFALPLVLGIVMTPVTIWPADISLPGRDADFWQWADQHADTAEAAYRAYLDNLAIKAKQNLALNLRMSREMLVAKLCGLAAPVAGVAATAGNLIL